jgi:hypothetical protein
MGHGPLNALPLILRISTKVGKSLGRWAMKSSAVSESAKKRVKIPKKNKKRSLYIDAGVVLALIILLGIVNHDLLRRHSSVKASNTGAATAPGAPVAPLVPSKALVISPSSSPKMLPASFRPLNFALLRGGFTSPDEFFERVNGDPTLHSFYGDCSDRQASLHPLAQDAVVFTAFRRNNQINWAKKPLLVHQGEYVLTYCGKTVLARCGNLISLAAMEPSEDIPPDLLETPVDPVEPPLTYAAEPSDSTIAPVAAVASVAHRSRFFFFVPPFYIPSSGGHTTAPAPLSVVPPPPTSVSGDEFEGHQALFTLLFGLMAIALVKFVTR